MRSWDSRPDTYVCDEPLYAHYLASTGLDHPERDVVIRQGETDWRKVVEWLTGPVPEGKPIFYQKHMAHHLLPGMEGEWLATLRNALLIRDPEEMLISLGKVVPDPTLEDTGLPQQIDLFERVQEFTGRRPPIIDARDVLERPRALLGRLCEALRVDFANEMLRWRPGPRETDGPWARYWYSKVEASSSFQPYRPPATALPSHLRDLERTCRSIYEELHRHRLTT